MPAQVESNSRNGRVEAGTAIRLGGVLFAPMTRRQAAIAGGVGVAAALARFAYSFFPMMTMLDIVVFGAAGWGVARTRPKPAWPAYLLVVAPTLAFALFTGLTAKSWAIPLHAAIVVPFAAVLGFLVGAPSTRTT